MRSLDSSGYIDGLKAALPARASQRKVKSRARRDLSSSSSSSSSDDLSREQRASKRNDLSSRVTIPAKDDEEDDLNKVVRMKLRLKLLQEEVNQDNQQCADH